MQPWNDPNFLSKDDTERQTPVAITEGDKKKDDISKTT